MVRDPEAGAERFAAGSRLKEEHGLTGGYTIVKDCVRQARLRHN